MLSFPALAKLLLIVLALNLSGCLSLGTRTTNVSESPETVKRISYLESRVGALEQTLRSPPVEILRSPPAEILRSPTVETPQSPSR